MHKRNAFLALSLPALLSVGGHRLPSVTPVDMEALGFVATVSSTGAAAFCGSRCSDGGSTGNYAHRFSILGGRVLPGITERGTR